MEKTAEIISVGTELLLGSITNTDSRDLSRILAGIGIDVHYQTVVGDNRERLRTAVEAARKRADILITTGGLGPTCDDLTKQVLSQCFGRKLVRDAHSEERIRNYYSRQPNRPFTDNILQQADLPEGCTVFDNEYGTAPGCAFEEGGTVVVMLPGPPSECIPLFRTSVIPYLKKYTDSCIISRTLKLFGAGEAQIESMLRDRMNAMSNPTLAPYAKEGEVELRITAKAETPDAAEAMLEPVEKDLCEILGDLVYGIDVHSLPEVVLELLKKQEKTFSCAESCTGGLIAKQITDIPGSSVVFHGGAVTYASSAKCEVLHVPRPILLQYGAVSAPVAASMAAGAKAVFRTDYAVSTTGVAGPDPDENGNPVGRVFVGLARPDGSVHVRPLQLAGTREKIRQLASLSAYDLLRRALLGLPLERENAEEKDR